MEITKCINGKQAALVLKGRLDASTSQELASTITSLPPKVATLVLVCGELSYLSSAGLRVILMAQKRFPGNAFVLRKVPPSIMDVLRMTGFTSFLNVEK